MTSDIDERPHPPAQLDLDLEQERVLDDLIWSSLATTHTAFAEHRGAARRFHPDVASFAAVDPSDPGSWDDLQALVGPGRLVMLSRRAPIIPPPTWARIGGGWGSQMVLGDLAPRPRVEIEIVKLDAGAVPQMKALVDLTDPGPFRPRTIELGDYYGVFDHGALVAMAGERLRTPDFTEVSGVCTHPAWRGRGLAAALSHHVASAIVDRGVRPILHVSELKPHAERIYTRLGFVARTRLEFVALQTPTVAA